MGKEGSWVEIAFMLSEEFYIINSEFLKFYIFYVLLFICQHRNSLLFSFKFNIIMELLVIKLLS